MTKTIFWTLLALSMQSCYTAGYSVIKGGYLPYYSYKDSVQYKKLMNDFGIEYANLKLDSLDLVIMYKNTRLEGKDTLEKDPSYWYPYVVWPGLHTWRIKSIDEKLIFTIGYYADGFALNSVCEMKNDIVIKCYGHYELKDLKRNGRILKKQFTQKFEKEIIPLMQPYFEKKSKKQ